MVNSGRRSQFLCRTFSDALISSLGVLDGPRIDGRQLIKAKRWVTLLVSIHPGRSNSPSKVVADIRERMHLGSNRRVQFSTHLFNAFLIRQRSEWRAHF